MGQDEGRDLRQVIWSMEDHYQLATWLASKGVADNALSRACFQAGMDSSWAEQEAAIGWHGIAALDDPVGQLVKRLALQFTQ